MGRQYFYFKWKGKSALYWEPSKSVSGVHPQYPSKGIRLLDLVNVSLDDPLHGLFGLIQKKRKARGWAP